MNQKAIRIIALVLAIIMAGGVLIVAFSNLAGAVDATETTAAVTETTAAENETGAPLTVFAENSAATTAKADTAATGAAVPATGTNGVPKLPVIIGIVAVLLIIGCVLVPKIAKK